MLLRQFEEQVKQYVPNQSHFLIAFSGGLDSTALLLLFAKLRKNQPHLQLRAIHIHHGLSPNADNWVTHCQHLCEQLAIPLQVEKVQILHNKGIEAGAREARYQAIKKHLAYNEILVSAHHLQDQSETFFLALKRGSGVAGLAAMPVCSKLYNMPLFRPLLPFSRHQLQTYVEQTGVVWIEDESNQDNRYERNFLRNQVLPHLRQRWKHFDLAVQRSAKHCLEQQQLLNELLQSCFEQHFDKTDRTFHLSNFSTYSLLQQKALLRLWFSQCLMPMPSTQQLAQILQDVITAAPDRNPHFQLGDTMLRRYQNKLYLTPLFADLTGVKIKLNIGEKVTLPDGLGEIEAQSNGQHLVLVWQQGEKGVSCPLPLTNEPIQLGFQYSGKVRLKPQAMRQEIKKVWQKFNIPVWQRNRIPLIFYGEKLQAALGVFICCAED